MILRRMGDVTPPPVVAEPAPDAPPVPGRSRLRAAAGRRPASVLPAKIVPPAKPARW